MTKFKLGLCMPGAVTSGAYTAGAVDYILRTLEKWNVESKEDNKTLPEMYIELAASGGTSAGGMSTIMMMLQLLGKENLLYDSWVNLDDDKKSETFDKALDTLDITSTKRIPSILNSTFIDNITERAFHFPNGIEESSVKLPDYISKDFSLILSHTLLNGVPLSLNLGTEYTSYRRVSDDRKKTKNSTLESLDYVTYEHSYFSFFNLSKEASFSKDNKTSPYIWFNPFSKDIVEKIKVTTQATGAFPIGLSPRMFKNEIFPKELILASVKKSIISRYLNVKVGNKSLLKENETDWNDVFKHVNENFESLTVDGGAMNNAPIGQLISELRNKKSIEYDSTFGLIQIDPYPNRYNKDLNEYEPKRNLFPFAKDLIKTLWGGNKTKRDEVANQNIGDFVIGEIFPTQRVRGKENIPDAKVLATSSMSAFGGVLSKEFREHDYQLGMENARNFLRYKFFFPVNQIDESDSSGLNFDNLRTIWNRYPEAKSKFIRFHKVIRNGKEEKIEVLPIIPDIDILTDDNTYFSQLTRPKVSRDILDKRKKKIKKRIRAVIDNVNLSIKSDDTSVKNKRFMRGVIKILYVNRIYKMINQEVIDDLKDRKLLD